jgi:tetratricopeptide (TPR) repeat protein
MNFRVLIISLSILFCVAAPQAQAQRKSKQDDKPKELSEFMMRERQEAFLEGEKQKVLGNNDAAEASFSKALRIDPDHDASLYEMARLYYQKGRIDDAIAAAIKASELDPTNIWYQLLLADLYKKTGQIDKIKEVFERLVEIDPDHIEYREDLALLYTMDGDYTGAIKIYNQIESIIGVTEETALKKRGLWNNLGKPEKGLVEIEQLVALHPHNSRYQQILAESYIEMGKPDKALATYLKVAEMDPTDPYIYISLSDLYRKLGDEQKAYEALRIGFANPELEADAKIQIMLTYYSIDDIFNNKKDQALELAGILAHTHPNDTRVLSLYSEMLFRTGQTEQALEVIDQVMQTDSSSYGIWEQKMIIESQLNKNQQLAATSTLAMELFPMQPLPYLLNGFANYQLKNYEAARSSLESGAKLVVDNNKLLAQFYTTLGDIYNQLNDHQKSDSYYDKALKIDMSNALVLNNYSYFLTLRNERLQEARAMASRANDLEPNTSSYMDTYGWVLYKLGDLKEAEKWVKKSLDASPEPDATVLEHYGDILYKLGKEKEALKYWQQAKDTGEETSELLDRKIAEKSLIE